MRPELSGPTFNPVVCRKPFMCKCGMEVKLGEIYRGSNTNSARRHIKMCHKCWMKGATHARVDVPPIGVL